MTRTITLAGFTLIAAAAIALELLARRRGHATLTDALPLHHPIPRLAVLSAWLWLGWHLFARVNW